MHEHAAAAATDQHPASGEDDRREPRGLPARAWNAATAVVGGVTGLLPHLLHHVGLLGGVALATGATGNLVFAALGLAFSVPMLRRLHRHFGTWRAPALALAAFGLMFALSAFVVGPAITADRAGPTPTQTPGPDGHDGHHDG